LAELAPGVPLAQEIPALIELDFGFFQPHHCSPLGSFPGDRNANRTTRRLLQTAGDTPSPIQE
jgi:hypothetical protein